MNKTGLPQEISGILDEFIENLKLIYGNDLLSVLLYGSAASGEYTVAYSNINLLVVLKDTGLQNLNKISKIILRRKFRALNPLFFTEEYIESSQDVFPIEFLDMKENYSVLFGSDCLKDLRISLKNLRFQCEQELKAKLINIKNIYLRNREKYILRGLLFKSFTSVMHISRNLLRLKGLTAAYRKEDVLKQLAGEFKIDTGNFCKILIAKQNNLKLSYKETESLLAAFVSDLEKIVNIVDSL